MTPCEHVTCGGVTSRIGHAMMCDLRGGHVWGCDVTHRGVTVTRDTRIQRFFTRHPGASGRMRDDEFRRLWLTWPAWRV